MKHKKLYAYIEALEAKITELQKRVELLESYPRITITPNTVPDTGGPAPLLPFPTQPWEHPEPWNPYTPNPWDLGKYITD